MTFGEKLVQLRKQHRLSQEELAARLKVSRQAVSRWETGETMPETENVLGLSRLFQVSTDYLLKEELEEGRLTVLAADSLINSQVTDSFTTLENLDLFMNTISANFDDVENVAIEAKSLEVTYNTMQHAGVISLLVIFGIPVVILVFGFVRWWKRRKA